MNNSPLQAPSDGFDAEGDPPQRNSVVMVEEDVKEDGAASQVLLPAVARGLRFAPSMTSTDAPLLPSVGNGIFAARRRMTIKAQDMARHRLSGSQIPAERTSDRHSGQSTQHLESFSPSTASKHPVTHSVHCTPHNVPYVHPANLKITNLNAVAPLPDFPVEHAHEDRPSRLLGPAHVSAKRATKGPPDGTGVLMGGLEPSKPRSSLIAHSLGQLMPRWKVVCLTFLNHRWFYSLMVILTFFTIFEDDVKHAAMPSYVDLPLEIVIAAILTLFVFEMGVSSAVRPSYFMGFYFWLDAIATASLVFEVPSVVEHLSNREYTQYEFVGSTESFITVASNDVFVDGKAGRVARIFRLLRMLRLYSLYKQYDRRRRIRQALEEAGQPVLAVSIIEFELMQEEGGETRVGQKLEELITRRVIVCVLTMILLLPVFDIKHGMWGTRSRLDAGGLPMIHQLALQTSVVDPTFLAVLQMLSDRLPNRLSTRNTSSLVFLQVLDTVLTPLPEAFSRRYQEVYFMQYVSWQCGPTSGVGALTADMSATALAAGQTCNQFTSVAYYDVKWYSQLDSPSKRRMSNSVERSRKSATMYNAESSAGKDVQLLQVTLSQDSYLPGAEDGWRGRFTTALPFLSYHCSLLWDRLAEVWSVVHTYLNAMLQHMAQNFWDGGEEDQKNMGSYETAVLENSILKIGALLAVGFGDAGAAIIAENIKAEGDINPMMPGKRMVAVFGFCDVRRFTDTTEVLLHTAVAVHGGAANKNIGDAFLLVWKFPKGYTMEDVIESTGITQAVETSSGRLSAPSAVYPPPPTTPTRTARQESKAVRSIQTGSLQANLGKEGKKNKTDSLIQQMLKFQSQRGLGLDQARPEEDERRSAVNAVADNALASFVVVHAALKRSVRLSKYSSRQDLLDRMPDFRVNLGYGLHVGWAIEGAIGSEYKIDASYLSPNVNMASRLEAATKQFGVTILLSDDFVRCLSPWVHSKVRQIDCVTVKGSIEPMGLWTYDVNLDRVPEPSPTADLAADLALEELMWGAYLNEWEENPDLTHTWGITEAFQSHFAAGFQAYKTGRWSEANRVLQQCRTMRSDVHGAPLLDGPTDVLLKYMAGFDFQAPTTWTGFRELTEK
ncbi:MAG: hypothetical protein WDW38_009402 [Sanguina aurantia]